MSICTRPNATADNPDRTPCGRVDASIAVLANLLMSGAINAGMAVAVTIIRAAEMNQSVGRLFFNAQVVLLSAGFNDEI